MALFHSFLGLSNTPLYICTTSSLSFLLLVDILDCFHVLVMLNRAAMNPRVNVFSKYDFLQICVCPGMRLQDHMVALCLVS